MEWFEIFGRALQPRIFVFLLLIGLIDSSQVSPLYDLGFIPTALYKANVYWSGNCTGTDSGYNITWGPQTHGTTIDKTTIPCTGTKYEVNLSGLRPVTNYTVWVTTTNADQSVLTKAIVVNIGYPDVIVRIRSSSQAKVSWARNCTGSGNYSIALSPKTNGTKIDKTTIPCNSNKTEVTLSGLSLHGSYTITITTVVGGQSDITKTKTFKISWGLNIERIVGQAIQGASYTIECTCQVSCTNRKIHGFHFIPYNSTSPSKFYNDTKINFPSLDRIKHEGTWRCNATASDGAVYTTYDVLLVSCTNLNITIHPKQYDVMMVKAGDSYSVECNVASASDKVELWFYEYDLINSHVHNHPWSNLVVGDVSTTCNIYDGSNRPKWTYPGNCNALASRLFVLKNTAAVRMQDGLWRCYQPSTGCVSRPQPIVIYGECNATELANTKCSAIAHATCITYIYSGNISIFGCVCKPGYEELSRTGSNRTCQIIEPPLILSDINITVYSTTATANVTWAKPLQGIFERYNVTVTPIPTNGEQTRIVIVQASVAYPFAVFTMLKPDTVYLVYVQTINATSKGQPSRRHFYVPRNRTTMKGWPTNSMAIVGTTVLWTCTPATAETYAYTWYRGTGAISRKQTFTKVIASSDAGPYRCDAKDSSGKTTSSLTRTLTVSNAPITPTTTPNNVKCTDKQMNDSKCDDHADCSISYGKPECTCKTGYRGDGGKCIPGLFYPIDTGHYWSTSFTSWSFGYRWSYWWKYKWYMYPRCHYLHSGEIIPLGCDTFRIICVHYNGLVTLHNNWREIRMLFQCLHNLNDWFQNGCENKPNSLECARQRCGNAAFIGGYVLGSAYCPEKTNCITFNSHIRNASPSWPWYKRYGRTKPSVDSKVVINKVDADIRALDTAYRSYKSEMVFVITWDNMIPFDTPKSGEHYSAQLAIATDGDRTFLINLYADFKMSQTPPKARELPIINSYSTQLPHITTKKCYQIDKANIGNPDKRFSMDQVIGNTGDRGKHMIVVPPLGDLLKKRCLGALKSLIRSIDQANVPNTCPFNYVHMRWYAIRVKWAYTWYKRFDARKGQKWWQNTMCFSQTWWWRTPPYTKSKQPEVCCYSRNEEPKPWQWWREWLKIKRADGISLGEIRQEYVMIHDSPIVLVTHGRYAGYAYSPEDSKIAEDAWKYCCHDADLCQYFHQYLPVSGAENYEPPDEIEIKGDPHFVTLDGLNYSFNGHGEYTLIKGSSPENILLLGRTAQPKSKGTTPPKATVFTGFCMAAFNADKVEVSLDSTGKLRILLNKTVEVAYSSLKTNGTIYKGVTLALQENVTEPTVIVNYDAGFTVTVKLNENLGYLLNSVYVDKKFKTKLEGLLGNYDGNKENDLKCANGTVIPSKSSDGLIFDCFQTWQVKSEAESCFSYASVPFEKRYNISFLPIFVDEYKNNMLTLFNNNTFYNAANKTCSTHSQENLYLACMYDASQLQTIAAAEADVDGYKETKKKTDIKINKRPVIKMPSHIRVSTNKTLIITIKVSDPENDTLTSMLNMTGYGATVTLADTTKLSILAVNASQFKFVASFKDSKMAVAKWEPEVHLCDVVVANGVCDYSEEESADKDTNDFDHYVAGVNCSDDCGGSRCEEGPCSETNNPCPKGTKCTAKGCKAECGPCPSGSERSGKICIDIDECAKTSTCQHNCNNTPEFSYTCWCNDGSQVDPNVNKKCIDFNECDYKVHNCSAAKNEVCENTVGSFKCICAKGYTSGSNGCQDVNECTTSKHNCAYDASCTNTIGGYNCTCKQGYFGSGTSCKDLNECSVSNKCQHECKNTVGSYTCTCRTGYDLAADGHSCTVSSLSKCGAHNCKHTCIKKAGVDTCECNKGWVLSTVDNVSCLDEDECSTGNNKCSQKCVNEHGGHNCTCGTGYKLEDDGLSCSEMNECADETAACSELATCYNTIGSYGCACGVGYKDDGTGKNCTEHKMCEEEFPICKSFPNWECKDYTGGYSCTCSAGYVLDLASDGVTINCRKATQRYIWQITVDVAYDPDLDNRSSKAHNTFGDPYARKATDACQKKFPRAKCSASYIRYGKGSTIVYMNLDIYSPDSLTAAGLQPDYAAVTSLLTALVQKSGSTCYIAGVGAVVCSSSVVNDANECTDGHHQCTSTMYCVNTPGEYECKCLPGFVDRQTGTSKIALQCEGPCSPNPCENNGTCAFSAESATGYKCTCEPGYNGTHCDVKVTAVDGGGGGDKSLESKLILYAIIGGVAGVVVIIAVVVGICCCLKKKNAKQSRYRSSMHPSTDSRSGPIPAGQVRNPRKDVVQ